MVMKTSEQLEQNPLGIISESQLIEKQKQLEKDPKDVELILSLTEDYLQCDKIEEAFELLQNKMQSIGDNPQGLSALITKIAELSYALGQTEEAKQMLLQATDIYEENSDIYEILTVIFIEEGNIADALITIKRALAFDNQNTDFWYSAISLLLESGDYKTAMEYLIQVQKIDPNNIKNSELVLRMLYGTEQFEPAEKMCEELLDTDLATEEIVLCYSKLLLRKGEHEEGFGYFDARLTYEGYYDVLDESLDELDSLPKNQKILITSEAADDHMLLYSGFLKQLQEKGNKLYIECLDEHILFMERNFPDANYIKENVTCLEAEFCHDYSDEIINSVDAFIPIGSIQKLIDYKKYFQTTDKQPIFTADPEKVVQWQERLNSMGDKPKILIFPRILPFLDAVTQYWESAFKLTDYTLLIHPDEIKFEDVEAMKEKYGSSIHWLDFDLEDYEEMTAVIAATDLVISPYNEAYVLAAGLGKQVWRITPHTDWRMMGYKYDPWFGKNVRVFPYSTDQTPAEFIEQIADALKKWKP
jgi:tetratricopeptide (TPR) repeat protein